MSSAIGPGTEVVCIDDNWDPIESEAGYIPASCPVKSCIYKVLKTFDKYGSSYLQLVEVDQRVGWEAKNFRPVRKTDISSLTALLVTPPAFPVTIKPKETV